MNQNPAGNSTLTIAPGRVPDGLLMIWTTSEFGCWKRILSQHALHHGLLANCSQNSVRWVLLRGQNISTYVIQPHMYLPGPFALFMGCNFLTLGGSAKESGFSLFP